MVKCLLALEKMLLEGSLEPYYLGWVLPTDLHAVHLRRVQCKSKTACLIKQFILIKYLEASVWR